MDAWHYLVRGRIVVDYIDYGGECNDYYNYKDYGSITL